MSGSVNLQYFVKSGNNSNASVGYLCPSRSDFYNFKFASICLAVLLLCGMVSMFISMATIWLESQASGYGVFAGNIFILTAVIGFSTYTSKTGPIIVLFFLTFAVMFAGGVTVTKAANSLQFKDYWCEINGIINKNANAGSLDNRCQAGVTLDLLVGGCATLALISAVSLFFITLRGIPCASNQEE